MATGKAHIMRSKIYFLQREIIDYSRWLLNERKSTRIDLYTSSN